MSTVEKMSRWASGLLATTVTGLIVQQAITSYIREQNYSGLVTHSFDSALPGLHFVFAWPIFFLLFFRRLWAALFVTIVYIAFFLYSVFQRAEACLYGGEICPPRPLLDKMFERLNMFEWAIFPLLVLLLVVDTILILRRRNVG